MMNDSQTEQGVRCFLVYDAPNERQSGNTNELEGLVKTLGLRKTGEATLARREPTPQYALGTGKAREITEAAKEAEADCIVFDFEITPTQQRNWEKLAGIPVYDREETILRIFASRARTKEAVMQVELAQLQYALPRLAHTYGDMARQRGGSYGSKGSGETQLELDRRAIMQKIGQLKTDLRKVVKERATMRKRRDKRGILSCAIVGYTNAGKSSLLNALTGADVFAEDALFATLDPTTRRLSLCGGKEILLTDTVGFIRNLPHTLVDSFRSTLEEAALADIILILIDASDMYFEEQYRTTIEVLGEIGADENKKIIAVNKIDELENDPFLKNRVESFCKTHDALSMSAKTGEGFELLTEKLADALLGEKKYYRFPADRSDLESLVRRAGAVVSSDWREDGILLCVRVAGSAETKLKAYEVPAFFLPR